MANDQVQDSPIGWVADHVRRYVESDGADGHEWRGTRTLLLTVTGRTTGLPRRTALIYGQDGDSYVVVASKGGAPKHPLWYRNLAANPRVEVQVGARKFAATARTADAEERTRLWPVMVEAWAPYDDYQRATEREIPVVVLDPVEA